MGRKEDLESFLSSINQNWGVILTSQMSAEKIYFLDLEVRIHNGGFTTKTFFKPTDRNGYFPQDSCHHPRWIKNVPKGQFRRIRKNCTSDQDYEVQSTLLLKRFQEKGNETELLETEKKKTGELTQEDLLKN